MNGKAVMTRSRALVLALLLALTWSSTPLAALDARRTSVEPLVKGVEAVGMTVSDLDRSVAFFTEVLDFEKVSESEVWGEAYERLQGVFGLRMRVARLRLGDEQIELTEYLTPRGRPLAPDARSNDRSFQHVAIIVSDMAAAYRRLREHHVTYASTEPQTLPAYITAAAGIQAFYFKDPDGHALEVLAFPADKGDSKWHRTDRLFLGIDHTAIVVADTDESLKLYRDTLGFRVAGESENYGPEQEHLNNVFGARLRITGLRAGFGPGVEFLEYLAPRDGRPAPSDLKANDLAHWQTTLVSRDSQEAARDLRGTALFVSPGPVSLPGSDLGFREGMMLRDRDGHALRLVEK